MPQYYGAQWQQLPFASGASGSNCAAHPSLWQPSPDAAAEMHRRSSSKGMSALVEAASLMTSSQLPQPQPQPPGAAEQPPQGHAAHVDAGASPHEMHGPMASQQGVPVSAPELPAGQHGAPGASAAAVPADAQASGCSVGHDEAAQALPHLHSGVQATPEAPDRVQMAQDVSALQAPAPAGLQNGAQATPEVPGHGHTDMHDGAQAAFKDPLPNPSHAHGGAEAASVVPAHAACSPSEAAAREDSIKAQQGSLPHLPII